MARLWPLLCVFCIWLVATTATALANTAPHIDSGFCGQSNGIWWSGGGPQYKVYRAAGNGLTWGSDSQVNVTSRLTAFLDVGVAQTRAYRYFVKSTDSTGGPSNYAYCFSPFVTRVGTKLYLSGQPYRFVGLNFFQANMTSSIANCSSWAANGDLDNQISLMGTGNNVIRAWFFQRMATTNGARDWSAFDHTLAVARAHGYKVVATLADQWNHCEGPYKHKGWYTHDYRTTVPPGGLTPYRDWVSQVVSRYRDDPTIALWELINEPEVAPSAPCPADSEAVMQAWAGDVSTLIRSLDPNHLISLGAGGNGNCGTNEGDYAKVYALPNLDVCSYHDYWGPTVALSTDPHNGIRRRINECNLLSKPIYAGESGIKVQDVPSLQARADDFRAKLHAQLTAGAVGFLAWNWSKTSDIDYRIGPRVIGGQVQSQCCGQ